MESRNRGPASPGVNRRATTVVVRPLVVTSAFPAASRFRDQSLTPYTATRSQPPSVASSATGVVRGKPLLLPFTVRSAIGARFTPIGKPQRMKGVTIRLASRNIIEGRKLLKGSSW